ncbi:uncharacterized protein LOC115377010 [Myripristis murdjan]|uniref:uncharacterized protein LOC115377010 n=1 Tax=Myripristis murdjan TaxID=586833 RepID=UPI0011760EF3|nr:uncharacterized protein LOC115377010 [Myripristis murdjan]
MLKRELAPLLLVCNIIYTLISDTGACKLIGSSQPVHATDGGEVILPCWVDPTTDVTDRTVDWKKGGADNMVHTYRNGMDDESAQENRFKGRTALFLEKMTTGNLSLKLSNVTMNDSGTYTCSLRRKAESGSCSTDIVLHVDPKTDRAESNQPGGSPLLTDKSEHSVSGGNNDASDTGIIRSIIAGIGSLTIIGIVIAFAVKKCKKASKKKTNQAELEDVQSQGLMPPAADCGGPADHGTQQSSNPPENSMQDQPVEERHDGSANIRASRWATIPQTGSGHRPSSRRRKRLTKLELFTGQVSWQRFRPTAGQTTEQEVKFSIKQPSNKLEAVESSSRRPPEIFVKMWKKELAPLLLVCNFIYTLISDTGACELIGSSQPVHATDGGEVILPCWVDPRTDVRDRTVEWKKDKVDIVHVYRHGADDDDLQKERFRGRTSLFHDEMATGNLSLKLSNVTMNDSGTYRCSLRRNATFCNTSIVLHVDPKTEPPKSNHSRGSPLPTDKSKDPGVNNVGNGKNKLIGIIAGIIVGIGISILIIALVVKKCKKASKEKTDDAELEDVQVGDAEESQGLMPPAAERCGGPTDHGTQQSSNPRETCKVGPRVKKRHDRSAK